jgi:hypothetical protein
MGIDILLMKEEGVTTVVGITITIENGVGHRWLLLRS